MLTLRKKSPIARAFEWCAIALIVASSVYIGVECFKAAREDAERTRQRDEHEAVAAPD